MNESTLTVAPVYSSFGDDPELGELVEMFVEEMPDRISNLSACFSDKDWEGLGRLAHQLKGSAGSYGFAQISPAAARVEQAARQDPDEENIRSSLEQLLALCGQVRAGTPQ